MPSLLSCCSRLQSAGYRASERAAAARQAQRSTAHIATAEYVLRVHSSVARQCRVRRMQPPANQRRQGEVHSLEQPLTRLLDMMEEQLMIAAVKAHRSLYDPSHKKYKDAELRNAIWQQIAKDLSMEVDMCKTKWRTIRDGFTRALRQQKECKNGTLAKPKKPWRYQKEMEFLIPFISPRESHSFSLEKDGEEDQEVTGQAQSPADCSGSNDADIDDDDSTRHSSGSITTTTTTHPIRHFTPKVEVTPVSKMGSIAQPPSDLKRKSDISRTELLVDYLKYQRPDLELLRKEQELVSSITRENVCNCKRQDREEDPVEAFFFSMGQSVKRLPFHLQARVKMKVCQAVTDAELECLDTASVQ